jgi:porphobilinogen synthase
MKRMRRLRTSENIRTLVQETRLNIEDLVYPIFVMDGENIRNPIESMPNIFRFSLDKLDEELNRVVESGIKNILIFGVPSFKDEFGSIAYSENGITQKAIRYIKKFFPHLMVIADVCLCEYTSHGHCGIIDREKNEILNDETLPFLVKTALSLAKSGADIVAPSDMMDGRVAYIRNALDENGYINLPIMAYSAKYASAYYSPFRDAANSAPTFGDRKTYQMDYSNAKEAFLEVEADIEEGADIIMVKPALAYLDIIKSISEKYNTPLAAYNVSGEYSMVKAAAANGWIDEKRIVMENMTAIKRAGASIIITYHAVDVANWIKEG